MATVTFQNGQSVNFQGTPSPQDIEEVAQKMGVSSTSSPTTPSPTGPTIQNHTLSDSLGVLGQDTTSIASGAGKLLNMVETPFVDVAAAPVQLLAKATGQPDPFANDAFPTFNGQGITVNPATPAGFLQKAGHAAEIGLLPVTAGATTIGGMATLGGASGFAQSVAAGNATNNPSQLLKDTIYGTLFGTALGMGGKFLGFMGNMEQAKTGVVGAVHDAIDNTDPDLLGSYVDAAQNHGETMADLAQPTPIAMAEDEFDKRTGILTTQAIPDAGKAVGAAKKAAGGISIGIPSPTPGGVVLHGTDAVDAISDNINEAMQSMTGHQFTTYGNGEDTGLNIQNYPEGASTHGLSVPGESSVTVVPGRSIQLSTAETKQLENLGSQLAKLRETPNVTTASDVLTNINTDINKWNTPELGAGNSPVQGALKYSYGQIKESISSVDPALAQANSTYHDLQNLKEALGSQAGKEGQSSALMMRRVLSGDKSNSVVPLLNKLDAVTAPYRQGDTTSLVQHSILSNWATNMFGDDSTKQLLAKAVSEGNRLSGETSSLFGYPRQFMRYLVNGAMSAISPDPAAYAEAVAEGKPFSMNPLVRFIDSQMTKTTSIPILGQFTKSLQDMGVSATAAEPAAKTLFKIFLMQQLTRTHQFTPSNGTPQTLPVGKTLSF